jgi:hypothetical protein
MPLLTLTVNNLATPMDNKAQEVALITQALDVAARAIRSPGGTVTSGNINGDGGVVLGSWSYTPQASS